MKKIYVTNDDYELAQFQIYNDLPVSLAKIKTTHRHTFNKDVLDKILLKGEKWAQVEKYPHRVITSFARQINTGTVQIVKASITGNTIFWNYQKETFRADDFFKQQGWEYNHRERCQMYLDMNWSHMYSGKKIYKKSLQRFLDGE